jgi:hypothetical protein
VSATREEEAMDVVRASDQIDTLIEKRAKANSQANVEEMAWKASVRKHHAKLRRQHKAEWYCYFCGLADSMRRSAQEFDRKAEALLEEPEGAER